MVITIILYRYYQEFTSATNLWLLFLFFRILMSNYHDEVIIMMMMMLEIKYEIWIDRSIEIKQKKKNNMLIKVNCVYIPKTTITMIMIMINENRSESLLLIEKERERGRKKLETNSKFIGIMFQNSHIASATTTTEKWIINEHLRPIVDVIDDNGEIKKNWLW